MWSSIRWDGSSVCWGIDEADKASTPTGRPGPVSSSNDADLVGIPLQIAGGKRGLAQHNVELKLRRTGECYIPDADNVRGELEPHLQAEQAWLDDFLTLPVPD